MKTKLMKSIVTMLLLFTFLSNVAWEAGNALMPGVSTCAENLAFDDGDIDDDDFIPYRK